MSKITMILLAWFALVAATGYLWGFFRALGRNDRLTTLERSKEDVPGSERGVK